MSSLQFPQGMKQQKTYRIVNRLNEINAWKNANKEKTLQIYLEQEQKVYNDKFWIHKTKDQKDKLVRIMTRLTIKELYL